MTDIPRQPYIYEGADFADDPKPTLKSVASNVYETLSGAAHRVSETYENAKKPGMPLSVLSNVAREAPLASLAIAFLVGIAVARRR